MPPASSTASTPTWCGVSTTTPGPSSRSSTGRWVGPRTRSVAAAATTLWRQSSATPIRRGTASPAAAADALVLPMNEGLERAAAQVGRICRRASRTAVDYRTRSLRAKMRAADRSGATWVVIMNAEEAQRRVVQLRNLASGDQREVAWDALPVAITSPQGPDEIARSGGVKREGPE